MIIFLYVCLHICNINAMSTHAGKAEISQEENQIAIERRQNDAPHLQWPPTYLPGLRGSVIREGIR